MLWAPVESWPEFWMHSMCRASLLGGLGIVCAWIVCRLLPRMSPTVRSWLWRLVYVKLVLLVLWPGPIKVPLLPAPNVRVERASVPFVHWAQTRESGTAARPVLPARDLLPESVPVAPHSVEIILFVVWLSGVLVMLVRYSRSIVLTRAIVRQSQPIAEPRFRQEWVALNLGRRVKRTPCLLSHPDVCGPQIVGLLEPVVLLPPSFPDQYSTAEVRVVLAHELAHLHRHDLLWVWMRRLVKAVLFFHPLVWLADEQAGLADEMACDEAAATEERGGLGAYASTLLKIAGQGWRGTTDARTSPGLSMSRSYQALAARFRALEQASETSSGFPCWRRRWASLAAGLAAAALASFLLADGRSQTPSPSRPPTVSMGGSTQSGGGGGGYSSGGARGSVVRVIKDPAVQQEVGVTSEQKQRIAAILQRVQALEKENFQSFQRSMAEEQQDLQGRINETAGRYDTAKQQLAQATSRILEQLTPAQRTQLQAFCQQAKADPAGFQARMSQGQHTGGGGGSSSWSGGGGSSGANASVQRDYQDGGGPGGVVNVIANERVQQLLRLDQRQWQQVTEIIGQVRESEAALHRDTHGLWGRPGSQQFQERQKRFEQQRQNEESLRQAVNKAGDEILKELNVTQQQRVREICLQAQGADALFKPEVIQALGLSAGQQIKLANLRRTAPPPFLNPSQPATDPIAAQARAQLELEQRMISEVLTPAQQAKLQQLRGKEFAGASSFMPSGSGGWSSGASSSMDGQAK